LQHNNTFPQAIESEEIQSLIAQSKTRVLESFEKGSGLNTQVEDPDIFLSKYIGTTLKLVVLYVDLVGSTLMTRSLPVNRLATIMQAFTQEMSIIVSKFGGQVLKFVGDAVVAYFPLGASYSLAYNTAVDCSHSMIMIVQEAINPVISMRGYDELQLKIGLDTSEHSVIQYIIDEKPYADILGYGISMAAKLSSLANSNEVIISHTVYMGMHSSLRKKFSEVELDPRMWKYIDEHFQPGVWKSHPLGLAAFDK
jgi:class 3 adenylate cyclase